MRWQPLSDTSLNTGVIIQPVTHSSSLGKSRMGSTASSRAFQRQKALASRLNSTGQSQGHGLTSSVHQPQIPRHPRQTAETSGVLGSRWTHTLQALFVPKALIGIAATSDKTAKNSALLTTDNGWPERADTLAWAAAGQSCPNRSDRHHVALPSNNRPAGDGYQLVVRRPALLRHKVTHSERERHIQLVLNVSATVPGFQVESTHAQCT